MLFLLVSKIFCTSGRELFHKWINSTLQTKETINTESLKIVPSGVIYKDPLNYSSCNSTEYFSNVESLDLAQINYDDLKAASKLIYLLLREDKNYKKTLKKMLVIDNLIQKVDNFENFHKYVLCFIRNIKLLIYTLSFIELNDKTCRQLSIIIKKSMRFITKWNCQWQILQIFKNDMDELLIRLCEIAKYNDSDSSREYKVGEFRKKTYK
ncbi:putative SP-containing protein [Vairimorpha necatrix]|uniref:SP-containing protein n=1 Tax=Vairimorpha necatrix TaxID=6039 RepID=A0AAX4JA13_9MICR